MYPFLLSALSCNTALDYFSGCHKAVIVNALKTGDAPGQMRRLTMDEIDVQDESYSLHQLGVNHLLAAMKVDFTGRDIPKVVVIGAEAVEIHTFTDRLSEALEAAIEPVAELVARECTNDV